MGLIINIDQSLEQRTEYNILKEPLNDMLKDKQELWEKENPIDMIYYRWFPGNLHKFNRF